MDRGAWQLQSMGSQELDVTEQLNQPPHCCIRYSSIYHMREKIKILLQELKEKIHIKVVHIMLNTLEVLKCESKSTHLTC